MTTKKLRQLHPAEIPAQFADIQQMLALSDVARDYEQQKINAAELKTRLEKIISEPAAIARAYTQLTGDHYAS